MDKSKEEVNLDLSKKGKNKMTVQKMTSSTYQFTDSLSDSSQDNIKTSSRRYIQTCLNGRQRKRKNEVVSSSKQDEVNDKIPKISNGNNKTRVRSVTEDDEPTSPFSLQECGHDKMSTLWRDVILGESPDYHSPTSNGTPTVNGITDRNAKPQPTTSCFKDAEAQKTEPKKCVRFAESLHGSSEGSEIICELDDTSEWERSGAKRHARETQEKDHSKRWQLLWNLLAFAAFLTLLFIITIIQCEDSRLVLKRKEILQITMTAILSWLEFGFLGWWEKGSAHDVLSTTTSTHLFFPLWFLYDLVTLVCCAALLVILTTPATIILLILLALRLCILFIIILFLIDSPPRPRVCNEQTLNPPTGLGTPPQSSERQSAGRNV